MSSEETKVELLSIFEKHRKCVHDGEKRGPWPVAEIKQAMQATQGTRYSDSGEVMLRRRFIVWTTDR